MYKFKKQINNKIILLYSQSLNKAKIVFTLCHALLFTTHSIYI